MRDFISNVGVYFLKGIALFLIFGVIVLVAEALGFHFYMESIYPKIMSITYGWRLIALGFVGMIAHYTFWK